MFSLKPKEIEKIASGDQFIILSKIKPKLKTPFKCYIYCTKDKKYRIAPFEFADGWHIKKYDDTTHYACGCTWRKRDDLNGKVVGEFVCDKVDHYKPFYRYNFNEIGLPSSSEQTYFVFEDDLKKTCLTFSEFKQYGKGAPIYGLHISELKIYDKPKELSEFWRPCPFKTEDQDNDCIQCDAAADIDTGIVCTNRVWKAPQSWCYVEEL